MAFCANCGSQVEGRFCGKCGAVVAAEAGGVNVPPAAATPVQSAGMTENVAAALCYLLTWLTGILFLVIPPYNTNKTIRFHAFQSIFFGVAWIALWIVISIFSTAMAFVGLFFLFSALHLLLLLVFFVMWAALMYKAYNNEKWVLPLIGPLAEKQA
jgi:uncharacterized membrane protein